MTSISVRMISLSFKSLGFFSMFDVSFEIWSDEAWTRQNLQIQLDERSASFILSSQIRTVSLSSKTVPIRSVF